MAGTVPEFGPMSRLCPKLPDLMAMSRNPARLHKWGCGSNINLVFYSASGHGSRNLGGVVQVVGVATLKLAWSENFRARSLFRAKQGSHSRSV